MDKLTYDGKDLTRTGSGCELYYNYPRAIHTTPSMVDNCEYLYEIEYSSYNINWSHSHYAPRAYGCSGVHTSDVSVDYVPNWGMRGRNYDWYNTEAVDFVVRVDRSASKYNVMGVAHLDEVTRQMMLDGYDGDEFEYLPYRMVDGINEKGLCVQVDVIAGREPWGTTTGTNPDKPLVLGSELVLYMLSNCQDLQEAKELMNNINFVATFVGYGTYEYIFLVSDASGNVSTLLFENNQAVWLDGNSIITNFNPKENPLSAEPTQYTPQYPCGLERYSTLQSAYSGISDVAGMKSAMASVKYSQAFTGSPYDAGSWVSDALSNWGDYGGDLTWSNTNHCTDYAKFVQPYQVMQTLKTTHPEKTWRTVHTSIYCKPTLSKPTLNVYMHEDYSTAYSFQIE